MDGSLIRDGFPGERMRVLPRPLVAEALAAPATAGALVTDAGYFPRASHHGRSRSGARETIVIHCTAGAGWCEMGGARHDVHAGQVLVIPPGVPHLYAAHEEDPWTIWWAHVTGAAIGPLLEAIRATPLSPVLDVSEPARVASLLDRILRRMETDETTGSLMAAGGAAFNLLSVLAADGIAPHQAREDPIREVRRHLRENVSERIAISDLAAMTGYSESHFSALFRRATGYGALEYQTRLRMSRARELLDTTDRSIASVAAQVGYADPMYFSRQFRRIHGISPTRYRERGAEDGAVRLSRRWR